MNRQVYFAVKIHRMRWHFSLNIAVSEEDEEILQVPIEEEWLCDGLLYSKMSLSFHAL